ncbi:MAG: TolC family outer membrane protein [Bosea sp. (in: a-proteobacteria)]
MTVSALALLVLSALQTPASAAETLESALAKAYGSNPTLNAQRAALRVSNEGVPQALSGYRPRVTGTADIGASYTEADAPNSRSRSIRQAPRGVGITVDQTIWNAGRTGNAVSQAEAIVLASRELLRQTEQTVLLTAATSYMNVLRDTAILNLNANNVEVLEEQLRQTRDRFNVGEVTRTDVAQSEARLASSRSQLALAQSNLKSSLGRYRQIVGVQPKRLAPAKPLDRNLPKSLEDASRTAQSVHPSITSALFNVDAADIAVKVSEADLLPNLAFQGSVSQRNDVTTLNDRRTTASAVARLTVPIYEGGQVYSRTRQAKETAGQRRLDADVAREQVRSDVVTAWGSLEAAKAQTIAAQAQVLAAETALNGVREEAKVGQRTTLDVLNAQQELLSARSALVTAQRDRVVASYAVLQSTGRLNPERLGLKVARYNERLHYEQVRDKWIGLQTPDGR